MLQQLHQMTSRLDPELLQQLFAAPGLTQRWEARVSATTLAAGCRIWLGAISDKGHGRFWLGTNPQGRDVVLAAHRVGYALHHGIDALLAHELIRHLCDEPSCQTPTHWQAGTIQENTAEWGARRHTPGSPLRDTRGPRGRALALRTAALNGHPLDPIARLGTPAGDYLQDPLIDDERSQL